MEPSFWKGRWDRNEIGFHRADVNPNLTAHGAHLSGRVLVPLAGKTVDLTWLAERGCQVVAVELVETALVSYFEERGVAYDRRADGAFVGGGVEAYASDIFDIDPNTVGPCDAWYDRAALVALPSDRRRDYVALVARLLRPGAEGLVVTLDHGAKSVDRPPFPVSPDEVQRLLAEHGDLERVHSAEVLHENEHLRARGTDWLEESVWRFVRASPAV